jgi:hypothetical protein
MLLMLPYHAGYGQWLDRKSSCRDPAASVIVKITDSCPCSYPGNYYSNKRWCCGDMVRVTALSRAAGNTTQCKTQCSNCCICI